jgi:hypothetical protein
MENEKLILLGFTFEMCLFIGLLAIFNIFHLMFILSVITMEFITILTGNIKIRSIFIILASMDLIFWLLWFITSCTDSKFFVLGPFGLLIMMVKIIKINCY